MKKSILIIIFFSSICISGFSQRLRPTASVRPPCPRGPQTNNGATIINTGVLNIGSRNENFSGTASKGVVKNNEKKLNADGVMDEPTNSNNPNTKAPETVAVLPSKNG